MQAQQSRPYHTKPCPSPVLAVTTPLLSGRFLAFMLSVTFRKPLATASPYQDR